ncbi:MAG: hypothetical protein V1873_07965 [Verrucomicrobiota bacterium]
MDPAKHGGLLRHSLFLMAATLVAHVSNTIFQAVMGWTLTPTQYGVLYSMLGVILVVLTPLDAVRTVMAHFAARLSSAGQGSEIRQLVRRWAVGLTWFSVPLALLGILFSGPLAVFFKLDNRAPIIITSLMLAGAPYVPVLVGTLQGVQAFGWMAFAAHSWSVVRLAAGTALVLWVAAIAECGLIGQALGVCVSILLGVAGVRAVLGPAERGEHVAGSRTYFAWSLVVLSGFAVLMNGDGVILKHFFPPEQAGLFARAWLIGRSIVFLPMPIALAMFPKVASSGETAEHTWVTLLKALMLAGLVVAAAVVVGSLFPRLALLVLFHDTAPEPWMLRLVRLVIWAMSPLSIAYLIMNFELAQHRFKTALLVVPCALAYVAGVILWHRSPVQLAAVLGAASTLTLLLLALGLPWRRGRASAAGD